MWWRTSNCSPLIIYRRWEDERLLILLITLCWHVLQYLPTSVYSTTPPSLYQSTIPPPHPPYLPSSAPVTSSELACYVVPTNSYLTPPSQWPTQSGISVVPAAVLAADVLPEYYYGMNSGTAFPVSGPAVYHHHQQQHQQQHHPSSSLHQHESTSDHAVSTRLSLRSK